MPKFRIQLSGRGTERAVGKITEAQYEYWSDEEREYDLAEALTENFDYDENQTPDEARFPYPYFEYSDVKYVCGLDDDAFITITNEQGEEIVSEELSGYIQNIFGEDDWFDHWEETEEFYLDYDCEPGYYVSWAQGGKGTYFDFDLEVEEFDPKLLKIETIDYMGNSMIVNVLYDNTALENDGGDWWGKWSDYSVHKIEK
jgi:hypothetical protein